MSTCVVTRYDDVVHVLKNPSLFSSSAIGMNVRGRETRTVINTDPPLHTDLRGLVNRAFTPRMVADMEPRIREITAGLLDAIAATGETDIVRDLAVPLPVTVIAELLGVDPALREDFKRWSTAVVNQDAVRQTAEAGGSADAVRDNERAMEDFTSYFEGVIEERRRRPGGNDLISAIVRAEDSDLQLTPDDLLAFTALLLIAGNETTTNLIGNAIACAPHASRRDGEAAGRPGAAAEHDRRSAALGFAGAVPLPHRNGGHRDRRHKDPAGAGRDSRLRVGEPRRRPLPRCRPASTSRATRRVTSHSATASTSASARRSPVSKRRSRWSRRSLRLPQMRRIDDAPLERVNSLFLRGLTSLPLVFDPTAVPAG